jgi:nucleotide-binding universal stress UspA family protein
MNKILVAIDGSDHAWKALDLATDIAKQREAQLIVLHVVPFEPLPDALRQFAQVEHIPIEEERARYHSSLSLGDALTQRAAANARDKGLTAVKTRTAEGQPASLILEVAAEEEVDMIVLGSRGLSDPKALFLGSISHKVANLAECTCVTVK